MLLFNFILLNNIIYLPLAKSDLAFVKLIETEFDSVPRAGFEPAINGLKTHCPRPLDERGQKNFQFLISKELTLTSLF